ncbi:hypothetical protein I8748_15085 [Nostoc sp. CENA67]|uniref:Uncharacterized protein n=1 Tax=Amazonocrinis nigriterrae CENA67 TaxID=2794033 RepID=A0A8J7L7K1_9NOST|nr:hypothetical protein [Amazonocrinis nigriterrae]MBH8563494.1 hypothetical protein [Amazonocrinis nigriterrae CENA67]
MQCYSSVDSCKNYLQASLKSYRLGNAKTIGSQLKLSGDSIDESLSMLMRTRLSSTDRLLISKFSNARQRGLLAARRGDFNAAESAFTAARLLLKLKQLSDEGSLLYQSFLEQAEAYLDYRRGEFEQARNRIYQALEIDMILEEKYGYEIVLFGRIQLVHNLVRIDAGCMELHRSTKLAFQILGYLDGILDTLPIPGLWGYERVKRQRAEFVAAMFAQVTGEIATILAGKDRQFVSDLLTVGSNYMPICPDETYHCHPQAYAWLLVKQAFINHEVATFLERASEFLAKGSNDTPLLWYATLADLVALCDELALPESNLLKQEIVKDAATWKGIPQRLLSLFH